MRKIILAVIILCSAHFNVLGEGIEDEELIEENEDKILAEGVEDEKVELLDWGILLDISYGLTVLTDGGGLGLSYFSDHHLLTLRHTVSNIHKGMINWPYSTVTYAEGGLLYGYLFSNGIISGSMSGGVGVVWSNGRKGDGLAPGFPFELNGLIQIDRYLAVGVKAYGSISPNSFVGAQFCLRIGAVTQ